MEARDCPVMPRRGITPSVAARDLRERCARAASAGSIGTPRAGDANVKPQERPTDVTVELPPRHGRATARFSAIERGPPERSAALALDVHRHPGVDRQGSPSPG
jgi:hypothetical protein